MNYDETKEFARDLKRLLKKYPSLRSDLEIAKQYEIELFHLQKIDKQGIFQIERAGNSDKLQFFKIKKFSCKSLKGKGSRSGIRVVYGFFPALMRVVFIEIYYKGDKDNEDIYRIKDFLNSNK